MRLSMRAVFTVATLTGVGTMLWTLATVEPAMSPAQRRPCSFPVTPEQLRQHLAERTKELADRPDMIARWLEVARLMGRLGDDPAEQIERWLNENAPDRLLDAAADGMIWYAMSWALAGRGRDYDHPEARQARAKAIARLERFAQRQAEQVRYWHWNTLGYAHLRQGAPQRAAELLKRTGESLRAEAPSLDEELLDVGADRLAVAWRLVGEALAEQGRIDAAIAAWEHAAELMREHGQVGLNLHWHMLGWLFHDVGADEQARDAWRRWLKREQRGVDRRPEDPGEWYNLACAKALLGQTESALDAWRQAVELGYDDVDHALEDRDLAPIRDEPAFMQGIERIRDRLEERKPSKKPVSPSTLRLNRGP